MRERHPFQVAVGLESPPLQGKKLVPSQSHVPLKEPVLDCVAKEFPFTLATFLRTHLFLPHTIDSLLKVVTCTS